MRMITRSAASLCLGTVLATAAACGEAPTGFTGDEGVEVRGSLGIARITNERGRRIYYFLIERRDSARILWGPCTEDLDSCPHVDPGQTLALPYSAIVGFDPGDEQAVLHWWHLAPRVGGGLQVDRLRSIVFSL